MESNLFETSPNASRTLDTVLLPDLNVVSEHRPQNSKDFDMTYKYLGQILKGMFLLPQKVSFFNIAKNKNKITNELIQ